MNLLSLRVGLQRMTEIRSSSTMWPATCSFPTYKPDILRDYMKARFSETDLLTFKGNGVCKIMDYKKIRGVAARNVTVPFWHNQFSHLHTDSSHSNCQFQLTEGAVSGEDNFGFYEIIDREFRCTEFVNSTTQYWFGVNA